MVNNHVFFNWWNTHCLPWQLQECRASPFDNLSVDVWWWLLITYFCILCNYVCFCVFQESIIAYNIQWISITCCVHYSHAAKVRGLCVMYSQTPSKQGCWRWTSLATCGTIERSSWWICPASAWCMDFQISAKPNQLNFGNGWTTRCYSVGIKFNMINIMVWSLIDCVPAIDKHDFVLLSRN